MLKDILIPYLVNHSLTNLAIKRSHVYLALKTATLKFVDISNFVAAGTTHSAFLKTYQCQGEKGSFLYEYVQSMIQLEETWLQPQEVFESWLKKSKLAEEDYTATVILEEARRAPLQFPYGRPVQAVQGQYGRRSCHHLPLPC